MSSIIYVLYVFGACFGVVYCGANVKQCAASGNPHGSFTEVILGECVNPPCPFKRGTKLWGNMTFVSDGDYTKLKSSVFASMLGVNHGYPGVDGLNACPYITPGCPLKTGETYQFCVEMDVKKNLPKVSLAFHFAVKDAESGKEIGCFESPIKIV